MCTYDTCHEGERLFPSRGEWAQHELWGHRRVWRCASDSCSSDAEYPSKDQYKLHLSQAHSGSFQVGNQEQLEVLCTTAVGISRQPRRKCPICPEENSNQDGLQKHIAHHLERLSTFALPRSASDSDDSQEEIGPGSGNGYGTASVQDDSPGNISWGSSKRPSDSQDSILSDFTTQASITNAPSIGDQYSLVDSDPQILTNEWLEGSIEEDSKEESKGSEPSTSLEQPLPPVNLWKRLQDEDLRTVYDTEGWAAIYRDFESPRIVDFRIAYESGLDELLRCIKYSNSGHIVALGKNHGSVQLIWVGTGKNSEATTIDFKRGHSASRSTHPVVERIQLNKAEDFTANDYECSCLCFSSDDKLLIIAWNFRLGAFKNLDTKNRRHYIWVRSYILLLLYLVSGRPGADRAIRRSEARWSRLKNVGECI